MSAESLFLQSINITLIGMSVVFVFLVILIVVVMLLSYATWTTRAMGRKTLAGRGACHRRSKQRSDCRSYCRCKKISR